MEVTMKNRVALITGSSMGLGYAMAKRFAESGADVALVARREEPLLRAKEQIQATAAGRVNTYTCDVGQKDQIENLFAAVIEDLDRVDVLVNNAGAAKAGSIESVSDEEWQFDLDLKLFAALRLARLVFPGMKERRWGRIINVLNTAAKTPGAYSAPTSVSRAAGMALTKVLAGEGAPHNILVNAFNIGRIKSDQIQRAYDGSGSNMSFAEFVAEAGKQIPIGRMGEAEECANLACFLCSEQGSYITGTSINVDGGLSPAL
jgi:NAD(P)-dependent dehydrogenase (short-subunit alcohol dehydrogenase family)|tara:strand:- start:2 stop:784 length:783 start_codon:yes stop_codon:yes gene_type:complete